MPGGVVDGVAAAGGHGPRQESSVVDRPSLHRPPGVAVDTCFEAAFYCDIAEFLCKKV